MDILDEILDSLASVEEQIHVETHTLSEITREAKETNSLYTRDSGVVVRYRKAVSALEKEVGCFINDVDYAANNRAINRQFRSLRLKPISIEEDGVEVSIRPAGRMKIRFGGKARYYCTLEIPLKIDVSQSNTRKVRLNVRMSFDTPGDGLLVPRIIQSPRFIEDGETVDIFQSMPVAKQNRIRQIVLDKMNEMMSSSATSLDPITMGSIAIVPKPILVAYEGGLLRVLSRERGSRRAKEPLVRHLNYSRDEVVRLRKHLVEPTIRKEIGSMASITGITWEFDRFWSYIDVSTQREDKENILHIEVITTVTMRHHITFRTGLNNVVTLNAQYREWRYRIRAKRCWPVCRPVIQKAKEMVMDAINAAKNITRTMGRIDSQYADVYVQNDRHGLVLGFNRRN